MAVRDVINYYAQVEAQYQEMLADVKDYEQALQLVDGIKSNYERLSYIMFLLTKRKKYAKRSLTKDVELTENAEYLQKLKREEK